jgi:hypothetical protein
MATPISGAQGQGKKNPHLEREIRNFFLDRGEIAVKVDRGGVKRSKVE